MLPGQNRVRAHRPAVWNFLPLLIMIMALTLPQGCALTDFTGLLDMRAKELPPLRGVQVDLDYVFDPDPAQQAANLDLLIRRVRQLGIDTVFLQAFADPDGNGVAESLYFPSRFMPLREDLFAPAARRLRQSGVAVYGWLPMLAFKPPAGDDGLYVLRSGKSGAAFRSLQARRRLSPFSVKSRRIIEGIYRDFARRTVVDGILFHDDGVLSDFEDASDAALQQYAEAGFPQDIGTIRNSRETNRKWSRYKTLYLIKFSLSLLDIVRRYHPAVRSVRNLFANPVLEPESERWFAQSLPLFMGAYDYTALLAMPFMEQAAAPDRWLERLSWAALGQVKNSNRIIFELQAKNWCTGRPVAAATLKHQIGLLAQMGGTSFAYYPDDFHKNLPPADMIRTCLSNPVACTGRDAT